MYSRQVLDHLDNPRNGGAMADPSVSGEARNPVCGDLVQIFLKIDNQTIAAASFEAQGCPPTIAASSVLTEMITGIAVEGAKSLTPADISEALGGLPRNKQHCSLVVIDALQAALTGFDSSGISE